MANGLRTVVTPLPTARELIEAQQRTETPQPLAQADIVKGQFESLAGVCDQLATSCDSYANSVEQTKNAIKRALIELAALVALDKPSAGSRPRSPVADQRSPPRAGWRSRSVSTAPASRR
ncbi:hypothetical protein AB0E01_44360 [Nocardia vinacea]|uniref:WXG100-like domain-containing protein n=1 Tax=Nocardia vinacea TaxID=96468 RepID=UPI0033E73CA0